ncbi:MAG TPA: type II secretion system F family protein [Candidatus Acidoferrales bacterium]|nr:type II secretion system F family protein [Candidatus Acidoferrales bacterium]
MPTFSYRALQTDGKMAEGVLDAGSRPDALRQIETLGLRPVNVAETAAKAAKNGAAPASTTALSFNFARKKVSGKELENFTRLLSSLLAAGVPLSRALVILTKEASSPAAREKWKEVHDLVVDGLSLANAMAKSPETFPRVYVAMVEAGETGGFLDVVLAQIAEFQSREKELKGKVLTAMLYPCILFVLALIVLTVLLVFFIPKFQVVFASIHGSLPLITQVIVAASHAMRSYGLLIAAGLVGIFFLVRTWFMSEKGKRTWEGLILKAPLVGPLIAQFAMARFCRMLGTLIGAGVPLVYGLNVARRSIGNQILVDAVAQAIERVQQGGRLGQSLADCKRLFSGSVLEMIAVAEESGKLDGELVRIAGETETDLDRNLKTAVAFAEPLMLFLIAGFIGVIFIGMLLPVLSMSEYIK